MRRGAVRGEGGRRWWRKQTANARLRRHWYTSLTLAAVDTTSFAALLRARLPPIDSPPSFSLFYGPRPSRFQGPANDGGASMIQTAGLARPTSLRSPPPSAAASGAPGPTNSNPVASASQITSPPTSDPVAAAKARLAAATEERKRLEKQAQATADAASELAAGLATQRANLDSDAEAVAAAAARCRDVEAQIALRRTSIDAALAKRAVLEADVAAKLQSVQSLLAERRREAATILAPK